MTQELVIWRLARLMIELHGSAAQGEAAARADERFRHTRFRAAARWNKVAAKIAELQTRTVH